MYTVSSFIPIVVGIVCTVIVNYRVVPMTFYDPLNIEYSLTNTSFAIQTLLVITIVLANDC